MNVENRSIDEMQAFAHEHGCAIAFLKSDAVDEDGKHLFKAMFLLVEEQGTGLAFHLTDPEGGEQIVSSPGSTSSS